MIISNANASSQTQRVWDASNRYGCGQMKQDAVAGRMTSEGGSRSEQNTNCLQFVNSGLFMQLTNIIRKRR